MSLQYVNRLRLCYGHMQNLLDGKYGQKVSSCHQDWIYCIVNMVRKLVVVTRTAITAIVEKKWWRKHCQADKETIIRK